MLAAANPIYGSYSETKSTADQIDLSTTILSRFDCIFVVKDIKTREHDERIATHVLGIHTGRMEEEVDEHAVMDVYKLQRYCIFYIFE